MSAAKKKGNLTEADVRGRGGSYIRHADGSYSLNAAPTQDHPDGNAPRDAEGRRFDRAQEPHPHPGLPPEGEGGQSQEKSA
jgi:hypothetical protein